MNLSEIIVDAWDGLLDMQELLQLFRDAPELSDSPGGRLKLDTALMDLQRLIVLARRALPQLRTQPTCWRCRSCPDHAAPPTMTCPPEGQFQRRYAPARPTPRGTWPRHQAAPRPPMGRPWHHAPRQETERARQRDSQSPPPPRNPRHAAAPRDALPPVMTAGELRRLGLWPTQRSGRH